MTTSALTVSIRAYAHSDYDSCLGVFDSNVPKYFAPAERSDFVSFLHVPNAEFVVAEREGSVIGCGGWYSRDLIGRLCWGMIHSAMHRTSAGSALLQFRLDRLFSVTETDEVRFDTSQHTAAFFSKFGFVIDGVESEGFASGIDCVRMSISRQEWLRRRGNASFVANAD
jgi:hypothetical protein